MTISNEKDLEIEKTEIKINGEYFDKFTKLSVFSKSDIGFDYKKMAIFGVKEISFHREWYEIEIIHEEPIEHNNPFTFEIFHGNCSYLYDDCEITSCLPYYPIELYTSTAVKTYNSKIIVHGKVIVTDLIKHVKQ